MPWRQLVWPFYMFIGLFDIVFFLCEQAMSVICSFLKKDLLRCSWYTVHWAYLSVQFYKFLHMCTCMKAPPQLNQHFHHPPKCLFSFKAPLPPSLPPPHLSPHHCLIAPSLASASVHLLDLKYLPGWISLLLVLVSSVYFYSQSGTSVLI